MRRIFYALVLLLNAGMITSWARPEGPGPTSLRPPLETGRLLDYIIVDVNGARRFVKNGEELRILRGDKVLIRDAYLKNPSSIPREVQVVGLLHTRKGGLDARGTEFKTKDLASSFSEKGSGEVYAILARSKAELHGTAYLKILEPTLRYAEVTINGQRRVLRDGEFLKVSAKDLFHFDKIVTNLEDDRDVVFQIVENSRGDRAIRFMRHGTPFALIPLIIEE